MTIQNDRWLVCYNFKTHDGKGEITHSVLNDQEASEAWEGEELEEIFALAREDVCMKLGLDEGADGDVLGEMVLTSVVPLGRIDSISVAVDGDDYGEEFDTMTQGIRIDDTGDSYRDPCVLQADRENRTGQPQERLLDRCRHHQSSHWWCAAADELDQEGDTSMSCMKGDSGKARISVTLQPPHRASWWRDKIPKGWSLYHCDPKHGILLTPDGQMVTVNERYAEAMAEEVKQAHTMRLLKEVQVGVAEAKAARVKAEQFATPPKEQVNARVIDGIWVKFHGEVTLWKIREANWKSDLGEIKPILWQVTGRDDKSYLTTDDYNSAVRFIQQLTDFEMFDGQSCGNVTKRCVLHPVVINSLHKEKVTRKTSKLVIAGDGSFVRLDGVDVPWRIQITNKRDCLIIGADSTIWHTAESFSQAVDWIQQLHTSELLSGKVSELPLGYRPRRPGVIRVDFLQRVMADPPERANARVFIDGDGKVHHYGTFTGFIVVYGMAKFGRGWVIFDKFKRELTSSDIERDRKIDRTPFDIMSELDDKELELGETFAMKRDRVTPDWVKAMKRDKR